MMVIRELHLSTLFLSMKWASSTIRSPVSEFVTHVDVTLSSPDGSGPFGVSFCLT